MKNKMTILFLTSLLMNFFISSLFSQSHSFTNSRSEKFPIVEKPPTHLLSDRSKKDVIGWYNYGSEINQLYGNTDYYKNMIFPDSTVIIQFTNSTGFVGIHSIGQVFDPTSYNYGISNPPLPSYADYTLDSIRFRYKYHRFQTTNPDTLLIQYYKESNLHQGYAVHKVTGDTLSFYTPRYESDSNRGTNEVEQFKYLLEDKEATSKISELVFPVEMEIKRARLFAVTVSYIPGNPYNFGDTLDPSIVPEPSTKINGFTMYSYADKGKIKDEDAYNYGIYVDKPIRYDFDESVFKDLYAPGSAWPSFNLHWDVEFHVTAKGVPIGIKSIDKEAFKIFPNPATNYTNLYFSGKVKKSRLFVTDLSGRVVLEDYIPAGSGVHQLNVSSLSSGTYTITIVGGSHSDHQTLVLTD